MAPVSFFTGAELVDYLNEDDDAEAKLTALEQRIIQRLMDETGRWLGKEKELVEQQRVHGHEHTLWLGSEIVSLTSVQTGTSLESAYLYTVPLTEFYTDRFMVRRDLTPFPRGFVKVTYRAGYDNALDDVPLSIRQDVLDLVAASWRARVTANGPEAPTGEPIIRIPAEVVRRIASPAGT